MKDRRDVGNDEILYRRIPIHSRNATIRDRRYYVDEENKIKVTELSFYNSRDPKSISVNIALKDSSNLKQTQGKEEDGVIKLSVGRIKKANCNNSKFKLKIKHEIDPDYPDNDQHANIVITTYQSETQSEKEIMAGIRRVIANIANNTGWAIEPNIAEDDIAYL